MGEGGKKGREVYRKVRKSTLRTSFVVVGHGSLNSHFFPSIEVVCVCDMYTLYGAMGHTQCLYMKTQLLYSNNLSI